MFKAVIFDLDGTLLDTLFDLANSMNNVLVRHRLPVHGVESYKQMIGDGVEFLVKRALPESMVNDETIKRFMDEYRDEYDKNWKNSTRPYDGIIDLIDALSSQGLRLNVLSNKPHDSTLTCVKEMLTYERFDIVLGHMPGENPKPDPHGAIEISDKLGISPDKFLYLGDTSIDMKTAVAAGMYPVGVLWGFRTREELLDNGAKMLLEKPMDLLDILRPDI
jgi:phosphoglycolate phosphatase